MEDGYTIDHKLMVEERESHEAFYWQRSSRAGSDPVLELAPVLKPSEFSLTNFKKLFILRILHVDNKKQNKYTLNINTA